MRNYYHTWLVCYKPKHKHTGIHRIPKDVGPFQYWTNLSSIGIVLYKMEAIMYKTIWISFDYKTICKQDLFWSFDYWICLVLGSPLYLFYTLMQVPAIILILFQNGKISTFLPYHRAIWIQIIVRFNNQYRLACQYGKKIDMKRTIIDITQKFNKFDKF